MEPLLYAHCTAGTTPAAVPGLGHLSVTLALRTRFLGWRGSRSRWEGESLLHSCPLLSPWGALPLSLFACGILVSPPGENLPGAVDTASAPGPLQYGFRVFASCPSRMTHLHLSLWFSQKRKVCLLKCRLTCFFYKFLGITIDFWLRISKSYL